MADLFDGNTTWKALETAMDLSAQRHRLITNNVANIDTIGYKPKDFDFKKALQEALENRSGGIQRTHPKHMTPQPSPPVLRIPAVDGEGPGGDPVGIDREMAQLAENNLKYRTSVEMLLRKIGGLKNTIGEAGR